MRAPRSKIPQAPGLDLTSLQALEAGAAPAELLPGDRIDELDIAHLALDDRRLPDLEIVTSRVRQLTAVGAELRGLRIRGTVIDLVESAPLEASEAALSDVAVHRGRVGVVNLAGASLTRVALAGLKLSYVNLRGARLSSVRFVDCTIDELDAADATLDRVAFEACRVRELVGRVRSARDVDLTGLDAGLLERLDVIPGAELEAGQAYALAPLLAQQAGYRVVEPLA